MILQALKDYYDRKAAETDSDIAPEGWEKKEIPFVIVIKETGEFVQIEDTREGEGKNKRAKYFLVPQGEKKASGIKANLLWDTIGYVFGVDVKGKPERALEQKKAFIDRLSKDLANIEDVKPVISFLHSVTIEELQKEPLWQEIIETNPNISFRINSDTTLVCEKNSIREALLQNNDSTGKKRICLVTGNESPIANLHTSIKGVYGAQSAGANIVSFNLNAFRSFNKVQGDNAPVSESAVFAYTTAINTLLSKDSKQRLSIGDSSVVFWSDKKTYFETDFPFFFREPEKDNPDAGVQRIRALFESLNTGAYYNDPDNSKFFILGLAPNAARISVRFWHTGTIGEFSKRIRQHFLDLDIIKPPKEPIYYSLWRVLVNISSQDKSENIPPNIAGDFMRSILEGVPYPATLLQAALRRIHSDTENRVKPVRAALIKAYLNRYHRLYSNPNHKEILMSLDTSQPSHGYQLGRLFATLEKVQEEANPGLNATIRERFYGAACATPVTVFANLLRLKNHHIAKMEQKGRVIYFEKLLAEIMSNFNDFPAHLDLHEQGRFAIGYYHQRQDFFTSRKETETK
jgi:CRISPR-associated protein Csd1